MAAAFSTHAFQKEYGLHGKDLNSEGVAVRAENLSTATRLSNSCKSYKSDRKLEIVTGVSAREGSESFICKIDGADRRVSRFRNHLKISTRSFLTLCSSTRKSAKSVSSKSKISEDQRQFVNCFREAWPYIHRHRGCTIVLVIPGEVIAQRNTLNSILQDISLLHGLGTKLVIVPGAQLQIDQLLRERNCEPKYVGAYRITDPPALEACKEAVGRIHVDIEAKLSQGPSIVALRRHGIGNLHEAGGVVSSGNLVAAKRRGVINGIDFGATGEVTKVEVARVKEALEKSNIVLLSSLGYSISGEVLNCNTWEVATACAIALQADRLLCLLDGQFLHENNQPLRSLTIQRTDQLILNGATCQNYTTRRYIEGIGGLAYVKRLGLDKQLRGDQTVAPRILSTININSFVQTDVRNFQINCDGSESCEASSNADLIKEGQVFGIESEERQHFSEFAAAAFSCYGGVRCVQLLDATMEGALLLDLYTSNGMGWSDVHYAIRPATAGDYIGIQCLLQPLVESGVLVKHPSQLLQELFPFIVVEKDGIMIACGALIIYSNEKCGEVACFVVPPKWRNLGVGDVLLDFLEKKAKKLGLARIFLSTTQTANWLLGRGFLRCSIDMIPKEKSNAMDFVHGKEYYMKYLISSVDGTSNLVETLHIPNELSLY